MTMVMVTRPTFSLPEEYILPWSRLDCHSYGDTSAKIPVYPDKRGWRVGESLSICVIMPPGTNLSTTKIWHGCSVNIKNHEKCCAQTHVTKARMSTALKKMWSIEHHKGINLSSHRQRTTETANTSSILKKKNLYAQILSTWTGRAESQIIILRRFSFHEGQVV